MKTRNDPRHLNRIKTMQELFSFEFQGNSKKSGRIIIPIIKHLDYIDKLIVKSAPAFPINKIAKVDLAILRLALYELLIAAKTPPRVIIDEAVELAKELGGDSSPGFINGALGNLVKRG